MATPAFDNPTIQRIYEEGQRRIDRMRAELTFDADGALTLPFRCYGCDQLKSDFRMMTGDGLPLCGKCFDGVIEAWTAAEA